MQGNLSEFVKVRPEAKAYYELGSAKLKFVLPRPGFLDGVKGRDVAVLRMTGVSFTYPGTTRRVLADVTVRCNLNSRVAVLGVRPRPARSPRCCRRPPRHLRPRQHLYNAASVPRLVVETGGERNVMTSRTTVLQQRSRPVDCRPRDRPCRLNHVHQTRFICSQQNRILVGTPAGLLTGLPSSLALCFASCAA